MGKMGSGEIVIGLVVLAASTWCLMAGPCKGWMNQLTSKTSDLMKGNKGSGLDAATTANIKSAVSSPEAQRILKDYQSGRITEAQMRQQATALGKSYGSNYTSYYGGRRRGYRY